MIRNVDAEKQGSIEFIKMKKRNDFFFFQLLDVKPAKVQRVTGRQTHNQRDHKEGQNGV